MDMAATTVAFSGAGHSMIPSRHGSLDSHMPMDLEPTPHHLKGKSAKARCINSPLGHDLKGAVILEDVDEEQKAVKRLGPGFSVLDEPRSLNLGPSLVLGAAELGFLKEEEGELSPEAMEVTKSLTKKIEALVEKDEEMIEEPGGTMREEKPYIPDGWEKKRDN